MTRKPGGVGRRPQDGVVCVACGRIVPYDQYADALCWTGPGDRAPVAAHRACIEVFDGIGSCETCGGTGWIAARDPILGGYVDSRCPECQP